MTLQGANPNEMFHHNAGETYAQGAARATAHFKSKFDAIFAGSGPDKARQAFDQVMEQRLKDALVPSDKLTFVADKQHGLLARYRGAEPLPMTDHAFGQLLGRAGINVPTPFARKLLSADSDATRALLPTILHQLNASSEGQEANRYLVRIEDNRIRAVLTDSYKRIDSRPQLMAFAKSAAAHGLVPMYGCRTELRNHFRVALPQVFEPVKNEPLVLGLEWSNSDLGAGANTITMFIIRMWCTNTATCESVLRQVHLGKQIDAIDFESLSERTLMLQEQTQASAMTDIMDGFLSGNRIQAFCDMIGRAHEQKVNIDKAIGDAYSKSRVSKPERDKLMEIAQSTDVEVLPQVGGESAWRLSNIFSSLAQQTVSPVRQRELEGLAGKVIAEYVPANKASNLLALPASTSALVGEYTDAAE